jgi:hypothetical protein
VGTWTRSDRYSAYFRRRREIAALTDGSAVLDGAEHRWSMVGLYRIEHGLIEACWLLPLDQAAFDRAWSGLSASRARDPS